MRLFTRAQMFRSLWMLSVFLLGTTANATSLYVASGSVVSAYSLTGTFQRTFTPTVSWANAFALTVDSAGNVYVADSGANRVVEFNATGSQIGVFSMPADTSQGGISPQQIALDSSGNLYTTSINGDIRKFASSSGSGTTIETIPYVRGIMVSGTDVYASTSAPGGALVQKFTTTGGTPTNFYTTDVFPAGQLRGMAAASVSGTNYIYIADSTWVQGEGKILRKNLTTGEVTTLISGLNGPNSISISRTSLYVASYFGGDVKEYSVSTGALLGTIVSGLGSITGVSAGANAVLPDENNFALLTDAIEPEFFAVQHDQPTVPEPGTMALFGVAVIGLALARRVRA